MWASRIFILCVAVTYVAAVQMHINGPVRIMHCSGERQDHRQLAGGIEEPLDFLEFYEAAQRGDIDYINSKFRWISRGSLNNLLDWHNEEDKNRTILHIAALEGYDQVVTSLLEAGANPILADNEGFNPWDLAVDANHVTVVLAFLNAGVNPNLKNPYNNTPVYLAAQWGSTEVLRALLEPKYHADVNLHNGDGGWTALHVAARQGKNEALKILLEHGADPNIQSDDEYGWTPVYTAARNGETEALKLLLEYGGDIHKLTHEGWSPLMRASRLGDVDTAQILINAGARVGYAAPKGTTALHLAARSGHEEVVKLLLRNGADKHAKNKKGQTAADWARDDDYDELAELIDNWKTSVIPQSAASAISK